jgi:hypothetical protein
VGLQAKRLFVFRDTHRANPSLIQAALSADLLKSNLVVGLFKKSATKDSVDVALVIFRRAQNVVTLLGNKFRVMQAEIDLAAEKIRLDQGEVDRLREGVEAIESRIAEK